MHSIQGTGQGSKEPLLNFHLGTMSPYRLLYNMKLLRLSNSVSTICFVALQKIDWRNRVSFVGFCKYKGEGVDNTVDTSVDYIVFEETIVRKSRDGRERLVLLSI